MNEKTAQQADRQRLLIVDDDELVGRTLEIIAAREGFDVRVTCDPDRFLGLVGEWRPNVVAIDLVMPGMDGVQVLAELARREFRECVVITSGVGHGCWTPPVGRRASTGCISPVFCPSRSIAKMCEPCSIVAVPPATGQPSGSGRASLAGLRSMSIRCAPRSTNGSSSSSTSPR